MYQFAKPRPNIKIDTVMPFANLTIMMILTRAETAEAVRPTTWGANTVPGNDLVLVVVVTMMMMVMVTGDGDDDDEQ